MHDCLLLYILLYTTDICTLLACKGVQKVRVLTLFSEGFLPLPRRQLTFRRLNEYQAKSGVMLASGCKWDICAQRYLYALLYSPLLSCCSLMLALCISASLLPAHVTRDQVRRNRYQKVSTQCLRSRRWTTCSSRLLNQSSRSTCGVASISSSPSARYGE